MLRVRVDWQVEVLMKPGVLQLEQNLFQENAQSESFNKDKYICNCW